MADNNKQLFGIRDNHSRGKVADFLAEKVTSGSRLSVVSAYFTIYAYEALSKELDQIEHLNFLFGEPRFIASLDPEKTDKKSFQIEDEGLELANRLQQKEVARRCSDWIRNKVDIRSIRQANLLHGKLYHIDDGRREHALLGSSNFTRRGLGISATSNIELNLIVDSDRDRADLKKWFDDIWRDEKLVADVKEDVLRYLEQLYVNHAPEFIYFKTLYHVFERFLSGQEADAALFDQTAIVDTEIWKALFDFQKDGVKGAGAAVAPIPIVRATQNRPARALLDKAKELVQTPYVEAAANYARQAFELGVRATCELKRIEMRYCIDPKAHQAQDFLDKLKGWQVTGSVKQADWDATLTRLETLKNVVMNPYSHPSAPNIPKQEVEQAIDAVDQFLKLVAKK